MNERRKRIEELAARYFEDRMTDAEERELSREGDSGVTEELRVLFGGLDAPAGERMPCSGMPLRRFVPWWGVAAVALGAFLCVELLREPYCYIDGRAVCDRETAMRTTVYLGSFAVLESPGRIVDDLLENR